MGVDNFRNSLELSGILVVVAVTTNARPGLQNLDTRDFAVGDSGVYCIVEGGVKVVVVLSYLAKVVVIQYQHGQNTYFSCPNTVSLPFLQDMIALPQFLPPPRLYSR